MKPVICRVAGHGTTMENKVNLNQLFSLLFWRKGKQVAEQEYAFTSHILNVPYVSYFFIFLCNRVFPSVIKRRMVHQPQQQQRFLFYR